MVRVFLSYAHQDLAWVDMAKMLMELAGARVFVDRYSVGAGERWEPTIERELLACDVLCVFWSRQAVASDWVKREYTLFIERHPDRRCVPLRVDREPLPELLSAYQAPPAMLALVDRILEVRRDQFAVFTTGDQLTSRIDRAAQRRVLGILKDAHVHLDPAQRNKILALFGGSVVAGLAVVPLRSLAMKVVAALILLAAGAGVIWIRCDGSSNDSSSVSVDAPTSGPKPDTGSGLTDAAIGAGDKTAGGGPCLEELSADALTRTIDDPGVDHRDEPLCGFLHDALSSSQREFADAVIRPGHDRNTPGVPLTFPVCGDAIPAVLQWDARIRPEGYACQVDRTVERDPASGQIRPSRSMTLTCTQELPADEGRRAAADVIREIERCLARGWKPRNIALATGGQQYRRESPTRSMDVETSTFFVGSRAHLSLTVSTGERGH